MTEMILASLSKIWHLVPIVIAIVLIKKFMNNKSNKQRIKLHEEHEKNGLTLIARAVKKYEDLGFTVIQNVQKELGIDLHCSKDDKTVIVKCIDDSKSKSITSDDIKAFHSNALNYIKTNDIQEKDVTFRCGVLYRDVLDKSAIKVLSNDSYNCRYMIL